MLKINVYVLETSHVNIRVESGDISCKYTSRITSLMSLLVKTTSATVSGFQFRRDSDRLAVILGELLPRNQAVCAQGRFIGHAQGETGPAKVNNSYVLRFRK